MAAIEQNIVGSCTFHTNHVIFQLGMLIYTQNFNRKYVYCNMYISVRTKDIFTADFFAIKSALKIVQIEHLF